MYALSDFKNNLHGNIFGGITAAIVALPLALAFGIASGAGPIAGLYGAAIVGLAAAIFGGTPSQISGPTGPMTVVTTAMISEFIAKFPEQGLALAFTTIFLGGCIQVLLGLLRIGKYIVMVPYPVISGFMTGIGVIIIILEIGPLFGFDASGNILSAISEIPSQISHVNLQALLIGAITLFTVFFWRGKPNRIIPSPLLALIISTAVAVMFFPANSVEYIGEIPTSLPSLQLPVFKFSIAKEMLVNAIMLAVLGSIDSLLTSLVADNITGTQHNSDRELLGQGMGNALAGLFGGLPGAGATMRTVVNIRAGGTGPLSGAIHALILLSVAVGLGFIFENIPLAALAGILIKVGIDIIDWPFLKRLHRLPPFPIILMLLVLTLTVFVDLITAVFVGIFIKNMVTIRKISELQLGSIILSDGYTELDRLPEDEKAVLSQYAGKAVLFRITGPVSYAAGRGLTTQFENYKNCELLLIDIKDAQIIGISTAMVLEDLIRKALGHGTKVKLIGALKNTHQSFKQLGIIDLIGQENCVNAIAEAF